MDSSLQWWWDHERQNHFQINHKDGSRTYLKDLPWKWDEKRKKYFYIDHRNNGSRVYTEWEWDPEAHMYYYVSDGLKTYTDGSRISYGDGSRTCMYSNQNDGAGKHWAASDFITSQSSAEQQFESTKTEGKAKEKDTYSVNTRSPPSNQSFAAFPARLSSSIITNLAVGNATRNAPYDHEDTRIQNEASDRQDAYDVASRDGIRIADHSISVETSDSQDANFTTHRVSSETYELAHYMSLEKSSLHNWKEIQSWLPGDWQWDVENHTTHARHGRQHECWTCTPMEPDEPKHYPLTVADVPVVLPVEYHWSPVGGVTSPPDPRPAAPIDCRADISIELVRDLFITFQGSIGFYILINGFLQVIVPEDYDTSWASSHLPHKYGGLKVCYIEQTLEPTMLPTRTETSRTTHDVRSLRSAGSPGISQTGRPSAQTSVSNPSLKLNDFIEARPLSNHRKEKFSGRIGLKVTKFGIPLIVMSTHVITEAILARSHRDAILGRKSEERFQKLDGDWNEHVEIWASNGKIGTIHESFNKEAGIYPDGFNHDVTLIKPTSRAMVEDVASPVADLRWLDHNSWASLRQQTTTVKILADHESSRSGKSIRCSRLSDVLVVGEGIFLNQKAAAGSSKNLKEQDASTWKSLVSRALLYRVHPDFDSPNGHSGTALYAHGTRTTGTEGPGIVGFQSFVQRSGHVQNFEMEGSALERRLQLGRVAFYGAFRVPAELKEYHIF